MHVGVAMNAAKMEFQSRQVHFQLSKLNPLQKNPPQNLQEQVL